MMKVYIASGFFTTEQLEDLEIIKQCLNLSNFTFYSPRDECLISNISSKEEKRKCFEDNLRAITDSCLVIVNTRDKDLGTIFEAGYAYAKDKKILYFCRGLKGNFNLMLSQSGIAVATVQDTLLKYLLEFRKDFNFVKEYKGEIE